MKTLKNIFGTLATIATVAATVYIVSTLLAYVIVVIAILAALFMRRAKRFAMALGEVIKRKSIETSNKYLGEGVTNSIVALLEEANRIQQ